MRGGGHGGTGVQSFRDSQPPRVPGGNWKMLPLPREHMLFTDTLSELPGLRRWTPTGPVWPVGELGPPVLEMHCFSGLPGGNFRLSHRADAGMAAEGQADHPQGTAGAGLVRRH